MKKFLLISLMCAVCLAGFAQKKNQPSTMAVASTIVNIAYIGVANLFDIAVSGYNDDDLIVTSDQGSVEKLGDGKYNVFVKNPPRAIITVSAKNKRDTIKIGTREFRVKYIPEPVVRVVGIDNYEGGEITKAEFCSAIGLEANDPTDNCFLFEIKSFTVSANIKGFQYEETSRDAKFTPQQMSLIQQLKSQKEP